MSRYFDEGYLAYHHDAARRDDPYWTKGSTKSSYESKEWCQGWDQARMEVKGNTWEYPFLAKEEMN